MAPRAERTVVFDPASGDVYELNATGALVWQLYAAGLRPGPIARRLARQYRIDAEQALADVYAFLARVRRHGVEIDG